MEGKISFIILIAIVAFLSLSLALLGGYVFFIQGHNASVDFAKGQSNENAAIVKPKDDEIAKEALFEEKKIFNLKNDGNSKVISVAQIKGVEIVYFKTVAGIKNPAEKINTYKGELMELLSNYFLGVKVEEINNIKGRENIKKDLVKRMNDLLKENEKSKNEIIYNIVIQELLCS